MKKRVILGLFIGVFLAAASSHAQTPLKADRAVLSQLDSIDSDLIKKDSEYKLVFFGYAGCYHFCDPRLREIDPIYKELKDALNLKVLFVDISEQTSHAAAELFVKEVNSAFEAISPDRAGIELLQKKFQDVYIRKMPDGEYLHSGFLYLLKRDGQKYYLLKIYPEFKESKAVSADIKKISAQ